MDYDYLPVDPKPPLPRSVSLKDSTIEKKMGAQMGRTNLRKALPFPDSVGSLFNIIKGKHQVTAISRIHNAYTIGKTQWRFTNTGPGINIECRGIVFIGSCAAFLGCNIAWLENHLFNS